MTTTKAQAADTSIPTPWHVDPDYRPDMEYNIHIIAANGNTVCFMAWSGDAENNEAHEKAAAVIAAAPETAAAAPETAAERDRLKEVNAELLAAAEALYRWAAQQPGFDASEWKDVRAAISRATVTP